MTAEQRTLIDQLFDSWRCQDGHRDYKITAYLCKPEKLDELSRVQDYDKSAARLIEECQKTIELMTAYRAALYERYNEIATAPTVPVVKLKREHRYSYGKGNPVYYYLGVYSRNLNSGKDTQIESKCFEGKQRHEALKAFEDYKKNHPGIIAEKDIEKKQWER